VMVGALSVTVVGMVATDGAAASPTPSAEALPWVVPGPNSFQPANVSCPAAGQCVSVGGYTGGNELYADQLSGGSWVAAKLPNPLGELKSLDGISCFSAGSCTAVGSTLSVESGELAPIAETLSWSVDPFFSTRSRHGHNLQLDRRLVPRRRIVCGRRLHERWSSWPRRYPLVGHLVGYHPAGTGRIHGVPPSGRVV